MQQRLRQGRDEVAGAAAAWAHQIVLTSKRNFGSRAVPFLLVLFIGCSFVFVYGRKQSFLTFDIEGKLPPGGLPPLRSLNGTIGKVQRGPATTESMESAEDESGEGLPGKSRLEKVESGAPRSEAIEGGHTGEGQLNSISAAEGKKAAPSQGDSAASNRVAAHEGGESRGAEAANVEVPPGSQEGVGRGASAEVAGGQGDASGQSDTSERKKGETAGDVAEELGGNGVDRVRWPLGAKSGPLDGGFNGSSKEGDQGGAGNKKPGQPARAKGSGLMKEKERGSHGVSNTGASDAVLQECDLFHGTWEFDPEGPLYNDSSCPYISDHQNCRVNGRPDHEYENWRWRPHGCQLSQFDAHKFFRILRGKTIAFVGDSVARNQMESLLCLLSQVELPTTSASKVMLRYLFSKHGMTLVRMWSSWLVHEEDPSNLAELPKGFKNLYLDQTDERWLDHVEEFDVLVLCSAHWWVKPSAYLLEGKPVGGQLWKLGEQVLGKDNRNGSTLDKKSASTMHSYMNNTEAFRIAVDTVFREVAARHRGITVFRTYSPDHYYGGDWDTGGACGGRMTPLNDSEVVATAFGNTMLKHQMEAYERVVHGERLKNSSKFLLLDIFPSARLRADGHPGPYRNEESLRLSRANWNGTRPRQDCLHWCMPGPVDTWNQLLLEMLDRTLP